MSRLAVSNIAWPPEARSRALSLLAELGVRGLEIAPGLFFAGEADPFAPSDAALAAALGEARDHGLTLVSMQSLHFAAPEAALFGPPEAREAFAGTLRRAVDLAARLGLPNLVVGSPRNRVVPDSMPAATARNIALEVFRALGDHAAARGCRLAVEPNPRAYGTNFLNLTSEALDFVREADHPAVTLNFDVGALTLNGEAAEAAELFVRAGARVSHVHLSAPGLAPVDAAAAPIGEALDMLEAAGWDGWVSIEMRAAEPDPLAAVTRAVTSCRAHFGADSHAR